jgi:RNA polymerase sigma-70 factor (ECF subfamily)
MAFMPRLSGDDSIHYGWFVTTPESTLAGGPTLEERQLLDDLRAGDENVFALLVREHSPGMLRLARRYVSTPSVAEEVVQEAWVGFLRGLETFEGRSTLKTWLFRILVNTAMSRGEREARSVPFSALARDEADSFEPAVDPDRFTSAGRWAGHWAAPPTSWASPEPRLLAAETRTLIDRTIAQLPEAQATVITMCDIEGFSAEEVCNVLEISLTNQRVLLHRARARVRQTLERYLAEPS